MKFKIEKEWPKNKGELKACIEKAWDELDTKLLISWIDHVRTVLEKVYEKNGFFFRVNMNDFLY